MARTVVLGAGGFIGQALVARLASDSQPVMAVTRRPATVTSGLTTTAVGDIAASTDWRPIFEGATSVVHLASRAHQPVDSAAPGDWIEAEAAAAAHLAATAARAGLRQVILVSSAKVHGEETYGAPFRAEQALAPADPYGHAKARIETMMTQALESTDTALAIVRPPLVYGPGVRANFLALLKLVQRAPALPFAGIANRRSLVYRETLVDLLVHILLQPAPVRGAFLVRDGEDLSTPELVRRIGRRIGHTPALLPCPPWALRLGASALGQGAAMSRLTESLQLDDNATRRALSWSPPVSVDEGLAATCGWFLESEISR
jgi:nucleoside-diphosphate-sugar epimerase